MSRRLIDAMQRQAERVMTGFQTTRIGIVSSYDPATYSAKVKLQPADVETGWLPIMAAWVGNSWGLFAPPSPGDQVVVAFQEASVEAGIILGPLYSDEDRALPAPSGEFWLVHKEGASLKFTNDGKVTLEAPAGFFVNGDTTIDGNLLVSGDVTDQTGDGNDVTVKRLRDAYNGHHHTDVEPGSGVSGETDDPAE